MNFVPKATDSQILEACQAHLKNAAGGDGAFCYEWIKPLCERMHGATFHQTRFKNMAKDGVLVEENLVRGGGRRYYKLGNPMFVRLRMGTGSFVLAR